MWVLHQKKPLVNIGKLVRVTEVSSHHIPGGLSCLWVQETFTGPPNSKRGSINFTESPEFSSHEMDTIPILVYNTPPGVFYPALQWYLGTAWDSCPIIDMFSNPQDVQRHTDNNKDDQG